MSTPIFDPSLTTSFGPFIVPDVGTLGAEIRRLRNAKGLTQAQLATLANTDASSVSEWETGVREPNADSLRGIAPHLDVKYSHFLTFGRAYNPNGPRTTKRQREAGPDVPSASGTIPAHTQTTVGGLLGMLDPEEVQLVGYWREAVRDGGREAGRRVLHAAQDAIHPKSQRRSGGDA